MLVVDKSQTRTDFEDIYIIQVYIWLVSFKIGVQLCVNEVQFGYGIN
jgi:hypothetical protein